MNAVLKSQASPLARSGGAYWKETRRPLVSLAFVLPLLALYEGGILVLGPAAVRNGADVWLRHLLDLVGLGSYWLLPLLTVAVLLAWHHTTHKPWKVSAGVLYGMLLESALLGFLLMLVAHVQGSLLHQITAPAAPPAASIQQDAVQMLGSLISFLGAGVYEEVLFRLMLLPVVAALLGCLGMSGALRIGGAIVITSVVFSAAHYLGAHGDAWNTFTFLFRFSAGAFFALLFVHRGFGVAAGSHALYDIFVGL